MKLLTRWTLLTLPIMNAELDPHELWHSDRCPASLRRQEAIDVTGPFVEG